MPTHTRPDVSRIWPQCPRSLDRRINCMRCTSSWLLILRSSAMGGAGMHLEYRGTICQKSLGNPAIIGETPADRWLCVPSFRTVCQTVSSGDQDADVLHEPQETWVQTL